MYIMKKSIVLLLGGCLALFLLAACGGEKAASGGSAAAFNETGYPIVKEPVEFRVISTKSSTTMEYHNLPVFQELEKRTGIKINWEYTGPDWSTNKPLVLASGDLPDLFFGRAAIEESDIINNAGMFLELSPLIEKYGTNIKKMFEVDKGMERFARAYDGKIYGLPMKMPRRPEHYQVLSINQNWLDKLGLQVPKTTEEFYTVLKAFKEKDPNGNGEADEIPYSFFNFSDNPGCMDIFCSFGVVESMNDSWLSVTNGKVQYIAVQEGFKDAIQYLRRLYAEGLIDQEAFSETDWGRHFTKSLRPSDMPEIVGAAGAWSRDDRWGWERRDHYTVMLPLIGPKGDQAWRHNTEFVQAAKYAAEIPANSKNAEILMRWLDTIYDPIIGLQLYYGALGVVVMDNGDGTFDIPLPPPDGGFTSGDWLWANAMGDLAPGYADGMTQFIRNDALFGEQYNDKLHYKPYYKEYYPLASQSPDETEELSFLRTDIHPYAKEQAAKWIVNGGVEQEYDAFIRQLNNMGLPRMVEIYQGIYDRYMGK
jgi:putative aldouronate transport system substrate-binding protein